MAQYTREDVERAWRPDPEDHQAVRVKASVINVEAPAGNESKLISLIPVPGWRDFLYYEGPGPGTAPPGVIHPPELFGIIPGTGTQVSNALAPRVGAYAPACTPEKATGVDCIGVWYSSAHDFCAIAGRHRHDWDGGVYFHNVEDVLRCLERTAVRGDSPEGLLRQKKDWTVYLTKSFVQRCREAGVKETPLIRAE
ncbi:hypothetical protein QBC43DRAFT_332532 [Cladorrhinum sp. PSN259]|nr:hypothetical protein QBC43DRAFT_332532 [Cladorrhinum sp. PSN259]